MAQTINYNMTSAENNAYLIIVNDAEIQRRVFMINSMATEELIDTNMSYIIRRHVRSEMNEEYRQKHLDTVRLYIHVMENSDKLNTVKSRILKRYGKANAIMLPCPPPAGVTKASARDFMDAGRTFTYDDPKSSNTYQCKRRDGSYMCRSSASTSWMFVNGLWKHMGYWTLNAKGSNKPEEPAVTFVKEHDDIQDSVAYAMDVMCGTLKGNTADLLITDEEQPMAITAFKIKHSTYVNGVDVTSMDFDSLITIVKDCEAAIERLNSVTVESKGIDKEIAKLEEFLGEVIGMLDDKAEA